MQGQVGRIAVMWRGDRDPEETRNFDRLRPVFEALAGVGVGVEPVVCNDRTPDTTRDRLLRVDGVLVWVDPVGGGEDRTKLDALFRDVASHGIWVSAHPDTIQRMGTKEVLFRTKSLGWGTDTHMYATPSEFHERFPDRLRAGSPRVLKQNRGNGGIGVWKVTPLDNDRVANALDSEGRDDRRAYSTPHLGTTQPKMSNSTPSWRAAIGTSRDRLR